MRISDWSSDVCSSDLAADHEGQRARVRRGDAARHWRVDRDEALGGRRFDVRARGGDVDRRAVEEQNVRRGVRENVRSEEHTSELQSLMRISYAVFCLKKKKNKIPNKESDLETK